MSQLIVRRTRRLHRQPRGQSAVEIALLLPILLILLGGIAVSGFMFYAFIQVSNASREGARAGSVYRISELPSCNCLEQTVEKAIYDPSVSPAQSALGFLPPTGDSFNVASDVTISLVKPDNSAADINDPRPGDRLTVNITYRYTLPILSAFVDVFPQPVVIKRSVVMEIQ